MNRKPVLVFAASTLIVMLAFTLAAAKAPSIGTLRLPVQAAAPTTKTAEQQFKNIQVLKGIPADQLFPTMQFITASLGVECEFCHVRNAFEKDDKKTKQTARKMMEMMFALNKDNFEGHREVTCYSCHRGSAKPVAIPVVMTEDSRPATGEPRHAEETGAKSAEPKTSSGPPAGQLIDKYVEAAGGAAAIDKVTTRVMKGTIDFGGRSLPIDIYAKDPDERISFTHMQDGDSVTAFNGHEGWLGSPGRPPREMTASDVDGAAIDADLHLATHLKQMFSSVEVRGTDKIDDHEVFVVAGLREGKPPVELYFDQQSGLLVRLVRYGETALGWLPTQIDYADYRDTNGVKVPYRWTLARPGGRFTIQIRDLEQNVPVDDAKFVKPAPPPGQPAATPK
jgi:photosynthetic reaction center cytochrome c subunit